MRSRASIIKRLRNLDRDWPSDLVLFASSTLTLCEGHPEDGGKILATFPGIRCDGGDPSWADDADEHQPKQLVNFVHQGGAGSMDDRAREVVSRWYKKADVCMEDNDHDDLVFAISTYGDERAKEAREDERRACDEDTLTEIRHLIAINPSSLSAAMFAEALEEDIQYGTHHAQRDHDDALRNLEQLDQ